MLYMKFVLVLINTDLFFFLLPLCIFEPYKYFPYSS